MLNTILYIIIAMVVVLFFVSMIRNIKVMRHTRKEAKLAEQRAARKAQRTY